MHSHPFDYEVESSELKQIFYQRSSCSHQGFGPGDFSVLSLTFPPPRAPLPSKSPPLARPAARVTRVTPSRGRPGVLSSGLFLAVQEADEPANTCPTPHRPKVGGPANPVAVSSRNPERDTIGREVRHLDGPGQPALRSAGPDILAGRPDTPVWRPRHSCLAPQTFLSGPRSRLATSVATGFPQTPFCRRRLGQTLLFAGQTRWSGTP